MLNEMRKYSSSFIKKKLSLNYVHQVSVITYAITSNCTVCNSLHAHSHEQRKSKPNATQVINFFCNNIFNIWNKMSEQQALPASVSAHSYLSSM